ncbi:MULTISPECIES: NACHT domain-containing NTPase [unclassified Pseudomonas]|uniref:NACHT domain-containing protein n=1 Tax=unclassified Pseudomonas TaxID=196821 RepID=UPI000B75AD67|nr:MULTISPECIES: NACHT domain-containing protein [Pseudomonas]SNT47266.1 Predicted NTPase (NACHT family) [Pseudomonas sp. LAMO17WK12:I8]SNY39757.1 Predicted NTPase (NACHT family) [Pseudomonas sp. LAMO17WK12:I11]SNY39966.1 Predicted NTPase (NACHT family) [Pseudomonas sp. LAMO17WK12:I12]SNY40872.1 Predicted NTPase (NACHT family) [Pseudomonas sp. LAMO17WK12:I7]
MILSASVTAGAIRAVGPLMALAAKTAGKSIKENFTNWANTQNQEEVATALLKTGIVKTIWSGGKDIFIKDFYYPSKIINRQHIQDVDSIEQLPPGNLVIQGIVGQGKSIFMRHLACSAITPGAKNYIPVFIELQKVNNDYSIQQSIQDTLEFLGLTANAASIKHLAAKGHIVLLLDGFDEIPDSYVKKALLEIDKLQKLYPKTKIIVSSRPLSGVQQVVGFDVYDLSPLKDSDYPPFLSKLNLDSVKKESVYSAISTSSASVKELISTPLMLTLVVWVYESEQEIPSTLKEFFEKLFHVVFTRHDSLKAGFSRQHFSGLSETKLQKLFEAFCFAVIQNGHGRTINRADFNEAFEQAIEYCDGYNCDVDNFRKDIVKVACLMLEEGIDLTSFLHKSILDYFAAAFIIHDEEDLAEDFYAEASQNHSTWKHTIAFLAEADQYRYSKYYILLNVPEHIDWLNEAINATGKDGLYKAISTRIKNASVALVPEIGFGGWRTKDISNNEWAQHIQQSVFLPLGKVLDGKEEAIKELAPQAKDSAETSDIFYVPLKKIIAYVGEDFFRERLREIELDFSRQVERATQIVSVQAKKKKIFGRRSKKTQ